MMKLRLITLLFILVIIQGAAGQSIIIDSLQKQLRQAKSDRERLNYYLALFAEKATLPADTLMNYGFAARQIAQKLNDPEKILEADYMILTAWHKLGRNDTCMVLIEQQLAKKFTEPGLREIQRKLRVLQGNILNIMNDSKKAQEVSFELLKDAEAEKDRFAQVCALNLIGWSHLNLNSDSIAINWFHKALVLLPDNQERLFVELKNIVEGNIGIAYWSGYRNNKNVKQLDSAIYYTERSVSLARKQQFLAGLAFHLGNLALMINERDKDYKQAEQLLKEALSIRGKMGNPYYTIMDMAKMGELYLNSGQYKKGAVICYQAIKKADSANIRSDILWLYDLLAKNYRSTGMYKEYGDAMTALMQHKDSINKVNSAKELFDIQSRYDLQKKEATIANQKLKLIRRNVWVYGSLLLFLAAATSGWFIFRNYRRRQKAKMQKALEEEKILSGRAVKEAGEKERKRIAADLHDNLGVQANAILYNTELLKQEKTGKEELIGDLHDTAKEMLLNLRETLWAMKTTDIIATDLWRRIISFCQQMGRYYTKIKFTTDGTAPNDFIMSSAKALNVVMIIQESINNAVKHARADQVIVQSRITENNWQLRVMDNGRGFDMQEALVKNDSHGLHNMQDRAKAAGLDFSIETKQAEGTVIHIHVKPQ